MSGLEALAQKEYPGRVIVIGQTPNNTHTVVAYGITGRSPSSQARRLTWDRGHHRQELAVEVTDEKILATGNPALLVYPAIIADDTAIVVSNGAQTSPTYFNWRLVGLVGHGCFGSDANDLFQVLHPAAILPAFLTKELLKEGIDLSQYEPDAPNFTPRITGMVTAYGSALAIARRGMKGERQLASFEVPRLPGKGLGISTYEGHNADPLPSFAGAPFEVDLEDTTASGFAERFYEALGPKSTSHAVFPDYRVAVGVLFYDRINARLADKAVINRHGQ